MKYTEALQELEEILAELRQQPTDIDNLGKKVDRASELISWCRDRLRTVEGQLESLDASTQEDPLF